MKLSVAIAPQDALPSAFVVWRGLEKSIIKASEYGYDGVELALSSKEDIDVNNIRKICKDNAVEISAISTGQVFADSGLYLTHPDSKKRQETKDCLKGLIDLAAEFGQKLNIGRVRGVIPEESTYNSTLKLFVEEINNIANYADEQEVEIIIEPVNRYEINFINNLEEGSKVIEKINKENVKLMPDIFHMNIEDASIVAKLVQFSKKISYIHFADNNRLAPGKGNLNFSEIIKTLEAINYDGWITVEILPEPDPDAAALQAKNYLNQLI